ncbi:MAG: hypothetical protein RSC04_00335 [Bacteroidales bacterium]
MEWLFTNWLLTNLKEAVLIALNYNQEDPNSMMLHVRFTNTGTIIYHNGEF